LDLVATAQNNGLAGNLLRSPGIAGDPLLLAATEMRLAK
jgi:hypothetical protein